MKSVKQIMLLGAACCAASLAQGQIVFSDNFDSYASGSQLEGQGGWVVTSPFGYEVAVTNNTEVTTVAGYSGNGARVQQSPVGNFAGSNPFHDVTDTGTGLVDVDFRALVGSDTESQVLLELNGVGSGKVLFGFQGSATKLLFLRTGGLPGGSATNSPSLLANTWYDLRLSFDFAADEVSALYKETSAGAFTLLTMEDLNSDGGSASGYTIDSLAVRLRAATVGPNSQGFLDDLSIATIPEPGTALLVAVAGVGLVLTTRRRRH